LRCGICGISHDEQLSCSLWSAVASVFPHRGGCAFAWLCYPAASGFTLRAPACVLEPLARTAASVAVLLNPDVGAGPYERVSALAVRLHSAATGVVLGGRYGLEVPWVHAGSRLAEMIKGQPLRYRSYEKLVRNAVCSCETARAVIPRADAHCAVALVVDASHPFRAAASRDTAEREKPRQKRTLPFPCHCPARSLSGRVSRDINASHACAIEQAESQLAALCCGA
jgi:hypothetical protein